MNFEALIIIMMSAMLVNNYVLVQFLGVCPFLGTSKALRDAIGMGCAVVFVMLLAAAGTWPIQAFILQRFGLGFLQTIVFVLIIAVLVQFVEIVLKKFIPPLYESLGVYLPLMTTNCGIMALTLLNANDNLTFVQSITNAAGAGLGFLLAIVLFAGIREHTANMNPPKCFQGAPMTLISAAMLSISFFGFGGIIENLFGQ